MQINGMFRRNDILSDGLLYCHFGHCHWFGSSNTELYLPTAQKSPQFLLSTSPPPNPVSIGCLNLVSTVHPHTFKNRMSMSNNTSHKVQVVEVFFGAKQRTYMSLTGNELGIVFDHLFDLFK